VDNEENDELESVARCELTSFYVSRFMRRSAALPFSEKA
jgi:hypothetical protein